MEKVKDKSRRGRFAESKSGWGMKRGRGRRTYDRLSRLEIQTKKKKKNRNLWKKQSVVGSWKDEEEEEEENKGSIGEREKETGKDYKKQKIKKENQI